MNSLTANHNILRMLMPIILILNFLLAGFGISQGSFAESNASTSTSEEELRFTMVAVGDYPKGYFSDLEILPGSNMDLEVAVMNVGSEPVNLRIFSTNAHNSINGGFLAGERDEEPTQPASWVNLPEQLFSLEPSEQAVFPLTVSVPENTPGGQHISALVVETTDKLEVPGALMFDQVVRYSMSLGVLVPGEINMSFEIGEPVAEGHNILIPIVNTGNYLVKPRGEVEMRDSEGNVIAIQELEMGSVYGGYETQLSVYLPEQIPHGEYTLALSLVDEDSSASSRLESASIVLSEPEEFTGLLLSDHSITPNDEDIVFANVSVLIENAGLDIPAANVTLEVKLDGELVDEFPLATNQVLVNGDNPLGARYIPANMWESGFYTFNIKVYSVDPNGGQQIELLNEELDAEIVVP